MDSRRTVKVFNTRRQKDENKKARNNLSNYTNSTICGRRNYQIRPDTPTSDGNSPTTLGGPRVTRDGKVRGGTDYVYFRGRNCTEPAFITIGNYRSTKLLRKFANRLWIINPVPTRNIVRSKAISTGCNNIDPVEKLTNVATEVLEIELPFNLPVAMPLSYR